MEFRNPFSSAHVIGCNVDYSTYSRQEAKRGDLSFSMTSGNLSAFLECPAKWRAGWRAKDSDSLKYGNLFDCLVLRPDKFESMFSIEPETYPDSKTGEPKKWSNNANFCRDWNAEQKKRGRAIVSADEMADARDAVAQLARRRSCRELLDCSRKQVMVVAQYTDPETGIIVPVRILIDAVPDVDHEAFGNKLADLKTARSAHPRLFAKQVFDQDYDLQGSFYGDIYEAATGEGRVDWAFVVQENEPPWIVADPIPIMSSEQWEMGRAKYLFALRYYARCLAENRWPGYQPTRNVIGPFQIMQEEAWMAGRVGELTSIELDEPKAKQPIDPPLVGSN